jgi:AraC-like DNA-binding protein
MPRRPAPAAPAAVTPMAYARAIAAAYRRYGQDPAEALKQAQITPARLLAAEARISARQLEVLSARAMEELDDEALGAYSRRLPWGSYGMLARASLTSPTLGVALKRWCRHHGLLADDVRLEVVVTGPSAAIVLDERRPLARELREFSTVYVLRNIHGIACWYIDSRIPLAGASFPFAAPPHADAFAHMFPGAVDFGAPRAEIRFDARYLTLPLKRDEKALNQMLQRALPLAVLQYRRDRLIVEQVRMLLAAHPGETHSADGVAALLHTSARTLHRQLKEEGASLQQLKDEVRSQRARDLLLRTGKPLKQVAAAVGFRNEKSFIRAFAQWTGQTPAEFRAST